MGKKIIFDARVCDGKVHGISRVAEQIISNIVVQDKDNEYVLFVLNDYLREKLPELDNVSYRKLSSPLYSFKEQFEVLKIANLEKPDLFHSPTFTAPYFAKFPVVINIHDLTPMVYPEFFHVKYKYYYNFFVKRIARKATRVITSSECSARDITRFTGVNSEKISVVYNGAYSSVEKEEPIIVEGLNSGYILFVANEMPHKNFVRSAQAFGELQKRMPKSKLQMVAVGISDKYFEESLVKNIPNIFCMKYLTPSQLMFVYKEASILLFPSFYEGFGIPPIESMVFGTPVVSSNCSCMPEVLGDAALLVDPGDVSQICDALHKLKSDRILRLSYTEKGYNQAKKYSWQKSARQIIEIYKGIGL